MGLAHCFLADGRTERSTISRNASFRQLAEYISLPMRPAHVHDLAYQDRAYPGVLLQQRLAFRDYVLLEVAQTCWEEYVADLLP